MQLIFMMILTIFVMFIGIAIFFEIAKFFNQTLPIILRGWPSNHKEGDDKDEEWTSIWYKLIF